MKLSERYDTLKILYMRYHAALTNMVLDRIAWTDPAMVSRISTMPKCMTRVGIMDTSDPMVILHDMESMEVLVLTPSQVGDWNWHAVQAFPELVTFMRKQAESWGPDSLVGPHSPTEAWVRHMYQTMGQV